MSLMEFVQENDHVMFGHTEDSLQSLSDLVDIQIINSFQTLSGLHQHLEDLNLLNPEFLRPGWDAYFMVCNTLSEFCELGLT